MARKLEEILAELDEEDAQAVRDTLKAESDEKAIAKRDLWLTSEAGLKTRFPRAWRAFEKKRLDLGNMTDTKEIEALFKAKEEEYADAGAPISETPTPAPAPVGVAPGAVPNAEPDPAAAFGTPVGGGPPSAARDLEHEFEDAMRSEIPSDRIKLIELVDDMNAEQRNRLVDKLATPDSNLIRRSRGV